MTFTSLKNDGWELESAVQRNSEHPDKFEVPSIEELQQLQIGSLVKLLFLFWEHDKPEENMISCERMWVTIQSINEHVISGQLENEPKTSKVLKPLDKINFSSEHICSIYENT